MREIYWSAKDLSASPKWLCSTVLVFSYNTSSRTRWKVCCNNTEQLRVQMVNDGWSLKYVPSRFQFCCLLAHHLKIIKFFVYESHAFRSRWPRGLRRGSAAARLLGLRVRIPPGAWITVSCECCVLSEVSPTRWWLAQRGHTECGVSVIVKPR
jgi:hypothetical protein